MFVWVAIMFYETARWYKQTTGLCIKNKRYQGAHFPKFGGLLVYVFNFGDIDI